MFDSSDARRARKREQDRHSQRVSRERNRKRLAYLEALVQDLKQQGTTEQVQTLLRQRDDLLKERDTLMQTLKSVKRAINTVEARTLLNEGEAGPSKQKSSPQEWKNDSVEEANASPASASSQRGETPAASTSQHTCNQHVPETPDDFDARSFAMENFGDPAEVVATPADIRTDIDRGLTLSNLNWDSNYSFPSQLDDPIVPQSPAICACSPMAVSTSKKDINLWRFANETLTRPTEFSPEVLELELAMDQDTAVRAVVEGWGAVERRAGGTLPPSWQKLRQIDEIIFAGCGTTERLAMLETMHGLFRYHQEMNAERLGMIPTWYLARPSQTIAHSYAIDYFAWPGVRERFVFSQHRYCSNLFWQYFRSGIHMLWPYEFRDCYSRNLHTGEYLIAPGFKERMQDINAWAMSPDIFKTWPELSSDIPTYNAIPTSMPALKGRNGRPLLPPSRTLAINSSNMEQKEKDDEHRIEEIVDYSSNQYGSSMY